MDKILDFSRNKYDVAYLKTFVANALGDVPMVGVSPTFSKSIINFTNMELKLLTI